MDVCNPSVAIRSVSTGVAASAQTLHTRCMHGLRCTQKIEPSPRTATEQLTKRFQPMLQYKIQYLNNGICCLLASKAAAAK